MTVDRRSELRERIAARAPGHDPLASPLPGLRFHHTAQPSAFASRRVSALSLAVIAQGRKLCRIGDREFRYDAETCLVFCGEAQYTSSVIEASPARPYLSLALELPAETVVRTLLSLGEQTGRAAGEREPGPAFVAPLEPLLVDALCRLVDTLDDPVERDVMAPLIVAELVFRLLRSPAAAALRQAAARHGDQVRIDQAMAFMRGNLTRRLSVAAIARHVAMSPSHFAHRFREVARTSPMHYLKQARLHAARLALLGGGASPAEVAAAVGYQSAAHFSRDFKSYFALPPAAYARRFRDGAAASQDPATRSQAPASPPPGP